MERILKAQKEMAHQAIPTYVPSSRTVQSYMAKNISSQSDK